MKRNEKKFLRKLNLIKQGAHLPSVTQDGVNINLYLNLGDSEHDKINEIDRELVKGVGLLRTELIYMKSQTFPTEEQQLEKYRQILNSLSKEQPIIIRTLDIGADKQLHTLKCQMKQIHF